MLFTIYGACAFKFYLKDFEESFLLFGKKAVPLHTKS